MKILSQINFDVAYHQALQLRAEVAQTMDKIYESHEALRLQNETFKRSLERISGICGTPNAADGCRNIMKECQRVLTNAKAD